MSSRPRRRAAGSVVVIGDAGLDITFTLGPLGVDEKRTVVSSVRGVGGTGANTAVALRALGTNAELHTSVGTDGLGNVVLAGLRAGGLDTSHVRRVQGSTEVAVITIEPDGRRHLFVDPGIGYEVSFARARELPAPDFIVVTHAPPAVADVARSRLPNTRLVLALEAGELGNPAWSDAIEDAWLVITNEAGAGAAALSQRSGPEQMIVTQGDRGATVISNDRSTAISPLPVATRDATGAGDVFCAALLHFLVAGEDLIHAARLGSVAAGLAVREVGAQVGLPSANEVWAAARASSVDSAQAD